MAGLRVIARRNDRYRDIDNGTCAAITAINALTGGLTVNPDSGGPRVLDAAYVADHVEHAYALTGHGAQGATVEWAAVIGRPTELTAEWAYTALSRARTHTLVHVIAEPPIPTSRIDSISWFISASRKMSRGLSGFLSIRSGSTSRSADCTARAITHPFSQHQPTAPT